MFSSKSLNKLISLLMYYFKTLDCSFHHHCHFWVCLSGLIFFCIWITFSCFYLHLVIFDGMLDMASVNVVENLYVTVFI